MSGDLQPLQDAVCVEALSWVGTPYHHCADVKGAGVDCAMLLVRVYTACGLVPADLDPRPYAPDWNLHRAEERFLGWLAEYAVPLPPPQPLQQLSQLRPADVLCWRYGRCYAHGAVYLGGGEIVHAYAPARRVVVDRIDLPALAHRPCAAFRLRGLR